MTNPEFLTESLDHWRYVRLGLIAELENIPAGKFGFRPSEEVKSVQELAQHILEGSMMMVGELTRDQPNFQRKPHAELIAEYVERSRTAVEKEELVGLLKQQIEEGLAGFTKLGAEAMLEPVTNFDGSSWSRLQWFFHGLTEEMYHRGQLVSYERLMGLVPALTQRIQSAAE